MKPSVQKILIAYSAVLSTVFAVVLLMGSKSHRHQSFDEIQVQRIDVVEPDGTPRFIISDKAEFPGGFFKGKEFSRSDRQSAGMLFLNDEGTENGGMLFGGYKSADGQLHSYGHLSFDDYEQDQSMSLDTDQDGDTHSTSYQINDNVGDTLFTPEFISGFSAIHAMPNGPEKRKALADFMAKHPYALRKRASMGRDPDKSAVIRLRDPEGHIRILLRVAADGTPTMQFLDASGNVTHQWPDNPAYSMPHKNK